MKEINDDIQAKSLVLIQKIKSQDEKITRNETFFHRGESIVKSPEKIFPENSLENSINLLIYGFKVKKMYKNKYSHFCQFFIDPTNLKTLNWLSEKKSYENSRIKLSKILIISENNYQKKYKQDRYDCLYIYYIKMDNIKKNLVLKFDTLLERDLFWQGLLYFIREERIINENNFEIMTSHVFKNKVNSLIPKEKIYEFLKKNKIEIDDKFFDFLNNMFESSPKIAKDQFKLIMKELTKYDETIAIFSKYLEEEKKNHLIHTKESYLTVENLKDFFMYEQDQIFNNDSYIKKIIQSFEPVTEDSFLDDETMSIDGFKKMLFSNHNQIFDVNKLRTYQNMSLPLSQYYIKSSHNTYLSKNQLYGESSVESYINILALGYNGEPIIYHGFTLTTKILLRDVVKAIFDYGFVKNCYPIILSIENHCSENQQLKMSEIFRSICGNSLWVLPLDYVQNSDLPSPNDLKYKILIKSKVFYNEDLLELELKPPFQDQNNLTNSSIISSPIKLNQNILNESYSQDFNYEEESLLHFDNAKIIGLLGDSKINKKTLSFIKSKFSLDYTENTEIIHSEELLSSKILAIMKFSAPNKSILSLNSKSLALSTLETPFLNPKQCPYKKSNPIIIDSDSSPRKSFVNSIKHVNSNPDFKKFNNNLINLSQNRLSVTISNINKDFAACISLLGLSLKLEQNNRIVWACSSLSENKIHKIFKSNKKKMIDYNKKYLTRVYPSGKRIDSSNYSPIISFMLGVQMVALNIQTNDTNLLIYNSKFLENGDCGYLLKPEVLRKEGLKNNKNLHFIKKVQIDILSGHNLNFINEKTEYYFEISIKGYENDEINNKIFISKIFKKQKKKEIFNFGTDFLVWNPEFSFLVLQIFVKKDIFTNSKVAWYCIPINCIRVGYRVIYLIDKFMKTIENSFLFCHISITESKS